MTEPDNPGDDVTRATKKRPPRMPRWVMLTLIVVGLLVAVFVVLELTGVAGDHGPGQHTPGDHEPPVEHGS